jgi:hypothetical protein
MDYRNLEQRCLMAFTFNGVLSLSPSERLRLRG